MTKFQTIAHVEGSRITPKGALFITIRTLDETAAVIQYGMNLVGTPAAMQVGAHRMAMLVKGCGLTVVSDTEELHGIPFALTYRRNSDNSCDVLKIEPLQIVIVKTDYINRTFSQWLVDKLRRN